MDIEYWNQLAGRYDKRSRKYYKMYDKLISLLQLELSTDDIVLDIGTGTGDIPIKLSCAVKEFYGIDMSESMIDVAKEKIQKAPIDNVFFLVQDSYSLQFSDKKFGIVIIANLMHIVDNPEGVLKEAKRVLKEDGKLIVATYLHGHSIKTRMLSFVLKLKGHPVYTRFNEKSMMDLLNLNGFKIVKQQLVDNMIPEFFIVARKEI